MIRALEALKRPVGRAHLHRFAVRAHAASPSGCSAWKARGWRTADRKPVKNQDLWEQLDAAARQPHELEWHWVKGHSGVPGNERVDRLANEAIDALNARSMR